MYSSVNQSGAWFSFRKNNPILLGYCFMRAAALFICVVLFFQPVFSSAQFFTQPRHHMPLLQNSGDLNINISRLFAWTTDKTQPNPAVYNFYLSGAYALDQRWALTAGYARERHHLNIYSVGPAHWYQSKNDGILTTDNLTIGGIWRNRYNTKKVFTIAAQATYIAQEGSNILYTPYNTGPSFVY